MNLNSEEIITRLKNTFKSRWNVFETIKLLDTRNNNEINVEFAPYEDNWNYRILNNMTWCDYSDYDDGWSLNDICEDAYGYFIDDVKKIFKIENNNELNFIDVFEISKE
jgi:hypothetical protein